MGVSSAIYKQASLPPEKEMPVPDNQQAQKPTRTH
jgi:hypothetical protein